MILVSVVSLCRELQLVFDGIGEAVTPILTVYLGEECPEGVRATYALAQRSAIIEGIIATLLLIVCAPSIPRILDITDPAMLRAAASGVRLFALGSIFMSLLYLLTSYYLLIEKIALGFAACALRDMVLSIPLAVGLGFAFGKSGMFIGLAAAPAVAYGLLMLYIERRYGRENCPLFLQTLPSAGQTELYDLEVEPGQIMDVQKRASDMLTHAGIDKRTVGRVELLIEEIYMLIREKNGDKTVLSECSVTVKPEGVQIITKDDGVIFDVSEENSDITSLNAFVVAAYMEKLGQDKRHLTTMSFNRSSLLVQREATKETQ